MTETWRAVPDYEGAYEVSDHGRVRSLDRTIEMSDGRRRFHRGQLLKLIPNQHGYPFVNLGLGNPRLVHHLVALAFIGERPRDLDVCHNDGDETNCVASNLRYDTVAGNLADKRVHGTHIEGEKVHCAVLSEEDVRAIRAAKGTRHKDLADRYGISRGAMSRVIRGETWKHVV